MPARKKKTPKQSELASTNEKPVSLFPLPLKGAISALLAVKPELKPDKKKRKKGQFNESPLDSGVFRSRESVIY